MIYSSWLDQKYVSSQINLQRILTYSTSKNLLQFDRLNIAQSVQFHGGKYCFKNTISVKKLFYTPCETFIPFICLLSQFHTINSFLINQTWAKTCIIYQEILCAFELLNFLNFANKRGGWLSHVFFVLIMNTRTHLLLLLGGEGWWLMEKLMNPAWWYFVARNMILNRMPLHWYKSTWGKNVGLKMVTFLGCALWRFMGVEIIVNNIAIWCVYAYLWGVGEYFSVNKKSLRRSWDFSPSNITFIWHQWDEFVRKKNDEILGWYLLSWHHVLFIGWLSGSFPIGQDIG